MHESCIIGSCIPKEHNPAKSDFLLNFLSVKIFIYFFLFHQGFGFLVYYLSQLYTHVPGDCGVIVMF